MSVKICFWGKATPLPQLIELFRHAGFSACGVLDNNPKTWGSQTLGVETVSPENLPTLDPRYVVVVSQSFQAIADQVVGLGYPRERLIRYDGDPNAALRAMEYAFLIGYGF